MPNGVHDYFKYTLRYFWALSFWLRSWLKQDVEEERPTCLAGYSAQLFVKVKQCTPKANWLYHGLKRQCLFLKSCVCDNTSMGAWGTWEQKDDIWEICSMQRLKIELAALSSVSLMLRVVLKVPGWPERDHHCRCQSLQFLSSFPLPFRNTHTNCWDICQAQMLKGPGWPERDHHWCYQSLFECTLTHQHKQETRKTHICKHKPTQA